MLFEGKTMDEAVKKGLEHFGITRELAKITVLKEGKTFKGICIEKFSVDIAPKPNLEFAVDGSYKLVYKDDGVYIEINPPIGNGRKIKLEDVRERLAYKKVTDIDETAVAEAVETTKNNTFKIAPSQQEIEFDASLTVEVSRDGSEAYATMIPPDGGKPLTLEKAAEILKSNGVVAGIHQKSLQEMITENIYGIPRQIAASLQPTDGENGYVEYKVDINRKTNLNVEEDGSVNFHELGLIENVRKDQVLANIFPPTEGKDGQDVRGNTLKAKDGIPAKLPKGKNTELTEDKQRLIALIDGQVSVTNGVINILPIYEVKGNVDNSTGNIKFVGKVIIRGNVLTGFEIDAEGNIEVDGVVEGAKLKSGGDIILKRGVQGSGRGVLMCEGNLASKFIENCTVIAGGDVIAEAIMHSNVSSKAKIHVKGKKGLLVGGITSARNEIRARTIGSHMATLTQVEVGVDPQMRRNIEIEGKSLEKEKKTLSQVNLNIGLVAKMAKQGYVTQDKKILLKKSVALKEQLEKTISQREKLLAEMNSQLNYISKGCVKVEKAVHPGTIVNIGSSTMHVKDLIEYTTFYREGGEIRLGSFEG
jgi:hypothetical protein